MFFIKENLNNNHHKKVRDLCVVRKQHHQTRPFEKTPTKLTNYPVILWILRFQIAPHSGSQNTKTPWRRKKLIARFFWLSFPGSNFSKPKDSILQHQLPSTTNCQRQDFIQPLGTEFQDLHLHVVSMQVSSMVMVQVMQRRVVVNAWGWPGWVG